VEKLPELLELLGLLAQLDGPPELCELPEIPKLA